jgi:uncharacterized protein (TIGR00369 family)
MAELPRYAQLLQCRLEEQDGETIVTIPFHDDVVGMPGYLHGGAIAGLLEIAAFTALAKELDDPGVAMKPITITVDNMRPGSHHETHASAAIKRLGSSIANIEAFAWQNAREEPVAGARLNFLLERAAKA